MCGRYSLADERCEEMKMIISAIDLRYPRSAWHFGEIRPCDSAPVLVSDAGKVHARLFAWGFPSRTSPLINARAETAAEKPAFADCLAKRRCVVPAAGFFEWDEKKGKHLFTLSGNSMLYMAGLYSLYGGLPRYCIITTAANDSVSPVHHRMPLVLLHGQVRPWLDQPGLSRGFLKLAPPLLENAAAD